jgi:hypothetical protein
VYTVVEVWRGLADGAKSFINLEEARRYETKAKRRANPQEDDVRLFEVTISLAPTLVPGRAPTRTGELRARRGAAKPRHQGATRHFFNPNAPRKGEARSSGANGQVQFHRL